MWASPCVFTDHTLVARIECERITDNPDYQMLLRYTPHEDGQDGEPAHYLLKGDMWEVGGDILKWDPKLTLVGVQTSQKVTRISSHARGGDRGADSDSDYELNGGTDKLWLWLHEHGQELPHEPLESDLAIPGLQRRHVIGCASVQDRRGK